MASTQPHSVGAILAEGDARDTYELDADLDKRHNATVDINESDDNMPESLKQFSEAELQLMERKLVRKADLVIMPIIGILYILNYIDRQNLAAAKLQGIMDDLNMTTTQFATAISILFVGYLPFQLPSNLIMVYISRPGLYICCACVIWGAISCATAAVHSYEALLAVRVILGVVEAVFFPGAIYLLSAWYTKNELGRRLGGLYIAQQVGNAFGGLLAAAVLRLDGAHGIRGWRWLFIVEGSATVGIGIIFAFFLPEYPHTARMLTPLQRDLAVWRIEREAGAGEASEGLGVWKGFLVAFKDPKLYCLIFCNLMAQGMGSIANFFPTIVGALGLNSTNTLLLTAPPYVFAGVWYWFETWYSDRRNTIYPVILVCIATASMTYIISLATTNFGARYFALMLMPCGSVGPQLMLYKTINHHLPRPVAKRAAAVALLNSVGGVSNIWSSYLWFDGPRYFAAFGFLLANAALFVIAITGYKFWVRNENKKLEKGGEAAASTKRFGVTEQQIQLGWRYEGY